MVYNLKTKTVYTVVSQKGVMLDIDTKDKGKNLLTIGIIKKYISMDTIKHMVLERVRKHEEWKIKVENLKKPIDK